MKRLVLGLAITLISAAILLPTAAAPIYGVSEDNVGDDVKILPTESPNGKYAYVDEEGALEIDLTVSNPDVDGDGVSDNTLTGISDVFLINYSGNQYAHVWLTHESEDVTFFARGHPIESESNNVTLGPNESVAVGLRVDTTGETTDGLIDDITVHAKVAEPEVQRRSSSRELSISSFEPDERTRRFRVTGADYGEAVSLDLRRLVVDSTRGGSTLTLDDLDVTADARTLSLEVSVADASDRAFAEEAGLEALGTVVVDVEEGETRGATFQFSVDRAYLDVRGISAEDLVVYRKTDEGEPRLLDTRVVGERDGRVRFVAETPGFSRFLVAARVPDIRIEEIRVDERSITTEETANVSVVLENRGAATGSRNVSLSLDGTVVSTKNVTLGPGNRTTVTYTVNPPAGEYSVTVDETDAGTLSVVDSNTSTTERTTIAETTPGDQSTRTSSTTPATPGESTTTRQLEPSAFESEDIAGLILFLGIVLGMAVLVRRAPKG